MLFTLRVFNCLTYGILFRVTCGAEVRHGQQRVKVHSPSEQILEVSADGAWDEARSDRSPLADDRPVMRREHQRASHYVQVDASLASLAEKADLEDVLEAQKVAQQSAAKSIGFADDLLEELLHTEEKRSKAPNIVENGDFETGSSWRQDCPSVNYRDHADIAGPACSTQGYWNGAAHMGGNTSGMVWSIKSITDCFKNSRGAVFQDIRTTEGSTYELEFYTIDAFRNYKTSNETQVHVEVQSPTGTTLIDEAIAVMGSAFEPVDGSWSFAGPFPFQASSENTRIYFYAGGSACPMLDNVRVRVTKEAETTTTEAPETTPSTTTMARSSSDTAAAATANSIATAEAALKAGATAAATVLRNGGKAHEQSLAAANAAAAVSKSSGRSLPQQAFIAAKAAALAIQAAGETVELQCAEAGRAAFFVSKSGGLAEDQIASRAGDAAVSAVKPQNLQSQQMVECVAAAVKTACKSAGMDSEAQAECAGSSAISAAQRANMTEDEQAEAAGKAVEAVMYMKHDTSMDAWGQLTTSPATTTTTKNPEIEELLHEVQEAKAAAGLAAGAAAEAAAAAAKSREGSASSTTTMSVARGASYETEVFVTDHPTAEIPEAHPTERPFTSTTHKLWKNACPDKTRAPRGTWVVYNLSSTPILHSCLVKPMKDRVPEECCNAPGALNLVGATFEELYYSNDYGSCVTLTHAGPLAGKTSKLQCNSDNSVTYGEGRCGEDCSCSFQDVYTPGCYRASDPVPGTAWFIVVAGCDCTDHKAVVPHEFNLPPMEQNVGAADVLNVGPEEAARALNRQRQQLRAYYDQMIKDERVMSEAVNRLSSGKPIADAIFGMDTGEIPEKATQRMLDAAVQDAASAKYAINATVSVMGHALSTLKSGKPLADAVFGGDTSHLIQPHVAPSGAGAPGDLHLPKNRFKGKFPNFKKKEEPVETLRFSGDFKAIIGDQAEQFLQECSERLAPVRCVDVKAGSVLVTLEAESWDELEEAHAKINKEGMKLPSFGSLEKEEVKEGDSKTGEMTAEEKKEDLLNPDITGNDVKIVQSIFDVVHDEETKEVEEGKEPVDKSARIIPTDQERSNSDSVIGVSVAVFGFACVGLCIYSCIRARSRVKQKLGSAVSKRLMKRAQVGDTQLVITNIDDLKVGDEVLLGKEKITIKEIAIAATLSNGLAKACQSGDAVALSDEGSGGGGALSKDVVEGEKELRVTKMPQLKKGDVLKVGANEKVTVKSISKLLTISPALKSAHIIGTKIQKPGETATDTEVGEPDSPTAASAAAASETEPEGTVAPKFEGAEGSPAQ